MRIGINGFEAVVPRFGYDPKTGLPNRVGSGEYCYRLLVALRRIDKKNTYIIYLPQEKSKDMPKESQNWHYKLAKGRLIWTLTALSKKLIFNNDKIDVFFSPTHYLPFFIGIPTVIAVLDVSYLHFPELFKKKDLYQLKLWGGFSIRKADKIITISKSSKNDIIKEYKVDPAKIAVVYPGIKIQHLELKTQDMKSVKAKYGIKGNYILFVGTIQPRKNIKRLIEAFSKLKSEELGFKIDLELVIIGKKGWMWKDILAAPKEFGIENKVKFLHTVSDDELPIFYKNATCFVLPSLYEGFGLPILEAMRYGCPVLTSDISSLPEAGGDAALYFNPEDVNDIVKNLKTIILDSELREKLIRKGYEQVKKFSWEKTAKETLKILEQLAKSS